MSYRYFSLEELCKSDTATKLGIPNKPNGATLHNLDRLISDVLDPIRTKWGSPLKVTSGYRCYALNKAVGGAVTSQHLQGQAADISAGSVEANKKLFELIKKSGICFDQLIDEFNYQWVHISYVWDRPSKNRHQVLMAVKNSKGKTVYMNVK